jgi:hypothetical protein
MTEEGSRTPITEEELRCRVDRNWTKAEHEHNVKVPAPLRELYERRYLDVPRDPAVKLADFEDGLDAFMRKELPGLLQGIKATVKNVRHSYARGAAQAKKESRVSGLPKGRYRKPFEDRLRQLSFVVERMVPAAYLLCAKQPVFSTNGRRIPWQQLAPAWKAAYPSNPLSSKDVKTIRKTLHREYYRHLRDSDLTHEFGKQLRQEITEIAEEIREAVSEERQLIPSDAPPEWQVSPQRQIEHLARYLADEAAVINASMRRPGRQAKKLLLEGATKLRISIASELEQQERQNAATKARRQRSRDSVSRRALLRPLVIQVLAKGSNAPEFSWPLRWWFLYEVRGEDGPYTAEGELLLRLGL